MMPKIQPKLTYREFAAFPDDGLRHEILDGVHLVSRSSSLPHQRTLLRLAVRLHEFVEESGLGEVVLGPFDVLLSEHDIVVPDLLFVSNRRMGILSDPYAQGAPDLMVEILSPSTRRRDLGKKRARYELLGVEEYWAVEPRDRTVLVFRREGERFLPPVRLAADQGGVLTSPLFPGLEMELAEIFEDSDPLSRIV